MLDPEDDPERQDEVARRLMTYAAKLREQNRQNHAMKLGHSRPKETSRERSTGQDLEPGVGSFECDSVSPAFSACSARAR